MFKLYVKWALWFVSVLSLLTLVNCGGHELASSLSTSDEAYEDVFSGEVQLIETGVSAKVWMMRFKKCCESAKGTWHVIVL